MKTKKIILTVITIAFLGGGGTLAWLIFKDSQEYKHYQEANAVTLDGISRITDWKEWVGVNKLIGTRDDDSERAIGNATFHYDSAVNYSLWFSLAAFIFLSTTLLLFNRQQCVYKYTSMALVIISLLCLLVGIFSPMMEIGFFMDTLTIPIKFTIPYLEKDVDFSKEFDGRLYFLYQNKSVVGVVQLLFASGNFIVGICILLFSIINPFIKLIFNLILLTQKNPMKNKFLAFYVDHMGKWSMADVMVVSMFLGYLAFNDMNTGIDSETNVLIGLYFFLAFVVLSIVAGMLLKISKKKSKEVVIIN